MEFVSDVLEKGVRVLERFHLTDWTLSTPPTMIMAVIRPGSAVAKVTTIDCQPGKMSRG